MPAPTPEQLEKLPKHVQGYIAQLERDLEESKRQHAELFASQEITPISFHSELTLKDNPIFLTPARFGTSSPDSSRVRFWMNETRWKPHATREYIEIGRGIHNSSSFSRAEREMNENTCLTLRSMDSARLIVEPVASGEIVVRYQRW